MQEVIVFLIVACAAGFIIWKQVKSSKGKGCGSCGGSCGKEVDTEKQTKLLK